MYAFTRWLFRSASAVCLAAIPPEFARSQDAAGSGAAFEQSCAREIGTALDVCRDFCEALNCDEDPDAPTRKCNALSEQFFNLVYRAPPCVKVRCPCPSFEPKKVVASGFELLECVNGDHRTFLGLFDFENLAFDEYEAGTAAIGGFDVSGCRYFSDDGTTELVTALSGGEVAECRRTLLDVAAQLENRGRARSANLCPPP